MTYVGYDWVEISRWSDATGAGNEAQWRLLAWSEQNVAGNSSTVHFKLQKGVSAYSAYNYYNKKITITGTGANGDNHSAYMTWTFGDQSGPNWDEVNGDASDMWWGNVQHKSDGTLSLTCTITGDRVFSTSPLNTTVSLSFPTIPRGSEITAFKNFTIESGFSFSYKDSLDGKALTLACKMGSTSILTKKYTSSTGTHTDTIKFTEAQLTTIYKNIGASNNKANFTLTLTTADMTDTSTATARGTLASASNKPTVSTPSMTETSSAMQTAGVADTEVIRYLSAKKITATVSARNRASISSVKVKNGDSGKDITMDLESGNTYSAVVTNPTAANFIVTATDSRGFSTTASVTGTLKKYTRPSITKVAFDRGSAVVSSGFIKPTGSFWNGTIGSTTNTVSWRYKINSDAASSYYTPTKSGNTWSGSITLPTGTLLRDHTYNCTVTVRDAFGQTATYKASIGIAELSVWIGKRTVKAEGFVGEHYIGVFPVGAIYMSVTNTNPSIYFGGTWVQIAQGRTLIGVGSIEANNTSGYGGVTAGSFNPSVNNKGGTLSHSHNRGNLAAAFGNANNDINTIAYQSGSTQPVDKSGNPSGPATTNKYAFTASSKPYAGGEEYTFNHYTPVYGHTSDTSLLPPYLAVYIWQRTA